MQILKNIGGKLSMKKQRVNHISLHGNTYLMPNLMYLTEEFIYTVLTTVSTGMFIA